MKFPTLLNKGLAVLVCATVVTGCSEAAVNPSNNQQKEEKSSSSEATIVTAENAIDVKVAQVKTGVLSDSEKLLGEVFPNTNISLYAKVPGTIATLLVKKGDTVKKGQVIAQLDQAETLLSVQQAEAQLSVAQANIESSSRVNQSQSLGTSAELARQQVQIAEENYQNIVNSTKHLSSLAKDTYDRAQAMYNQQAISKGELDSARTIYLQSLAQYETQREQAETALIQAKTQYQQASKNSRVTQATLKQAQVELSKAKNALSNTLIKSTVDGIITDISVEEGDTVHSQKAIATVINLSPAIVKINVTEQMLSKFQTGAELDIYIASKGKKIKGKVKYIGLSSSEQSKLFPVELEVPNPKGELLAGLKAEVQINGGEEGILIPTEAILDQAGKSVVFVVQGERVVQKEITIQSKGTSQALVQSGVSAGDQVVITGQSQLKDKAKIRIVP
ncbi:efflux RND transporter periplasmic adaptor subunit [Brevibacillus dissolubilis]|uniref:efflux RND transporter periplasmic adaptor subunit n=1 Tax=Brevibacillus dissolubilis TaxID=1844116 RepID=UPI001116422D|nr:efflux RND transporter periplasmic adaptor subunit [Brevibacillus dissolubilis]